MSAVIVCAAAFLFGLLGSVPITGPIAVLVVARAAEKQYGAALRIGVGAAVAEGIYAGIAFWGFATFLASYPQILPISHGLMAVLLIALGVRFVVWKPKPDDGRPIKRSRAGTYLVGFTISAVNPTLLATWSGAVAVLYSRHPVSEPGAVAFPFGLLAATGVATWFAILVGLLRKYEGRLPEGLLTFVIRSMGVVLVGIALWTSVDLWRFFLTEHPWHLKRA